MFALIRIVYICLVAFCGSGVFAKTHQVRASVANERSHDLARSLYCPLLIFCRTEHSQPASPLSCGQ